MDQFRGIDLGDQRLDRRAVRLAERLASIPGAGNGWAETPAAYRFWVTRRGTCGICWRRGAPVDGLCLQGTTEMDFNGQTIGVLGPLS